MKFDWTISAGTILHLVGVLTALVAVYFKLVGRIEHGEAERAHLVEDLREMKVDVKEIKHDLLISIEKRLTSVEVEMAESRRRRANG